MDAVQEKPTIKGKHVAMKISFYKYKKEILDGRGSGKAHN